MLRGHGSVEQKMEEPSSSDRALLSRPASFAVHVSRYRAAPAADVPPEQERGGEAEDPVQPLRRSPDFFAAEVIQAVAAQRQQDDRGGRDATGAAVAPATPGIHHVAVEHGAGQVYRQ